MYGEEITGRHYWNESQTRGVRWGGRRPLTKLTVLFFHQERERRYNIRQGRNILAPILKTCLWKHTDQGLRNCKFVILQNKGRFLPWRTNIFSNSSFMTGGVRFYTFSRLEAALEGIALRSHNPLFDISRIFWHLSLVLFSPLFGE